MASRAASEYPIYSDSVEERETRVCFFDFHEIATRARVKTYPDVDFESLWSPAKSESQYPISGKEGDCTPEVSQ